MSNVFMRNAERYYDPTAGIALTNIERMERMEWKPGDIVTASRNTAEKKFIVLANDGFVLMGSVLLTREYESCVPVVCGEKMYANPYRLEYLNPNNYDLSLVRTATDAELIALRAAIVKVLSLPTVYDAMTPKTLDDAAVDNDPDKIMVSAEEMDMIQNQAKELIEARTEAKVFRSLYEKLLERMTA